MCGIVGSVGGPMQQDARRSMVQRMADAIVHRGPNDQGFVADGQAVIGMRRLSIIDLAGGQQPISNETGDIWVVCNGEIYGFRALRDHLTGRGHVFSTGSDAEVVVHLYEEYGEAFIDHLDGMFALALLDTRSNSLFLARDRLGIKPLYLSNDGGELRFSSEVRGLLAAGHGVAVCHEALRDLLTLGYSVAPNTMFAGVTKLPPATMLAWRNGVISERRYWHMPETCQDLAPAVWQERVAGALDQAVRSQLVSEVPLGAFLSGGLDSSTIVAIMARELGSGIRTYATGYAGGRTEAHYNELNYAQTVARAFDTNHTEITVSPDLVHLLPWLVETVEEPISDTAPLTTHLVTKLARQSSTVILSGVGGDEIFAGYNRYRGGALMRRYRKVPRWLRSTLVPGVVGLLPKGRHSRLADLGRYAQKFVQGAELDWRAQYRHFVAINEAPERLLSCPVDGVDGLTRIAAEVTSSDDLQRLLAVDWQTQLSECLLLLTDKVTMAHSMECRVPLLDQDLVELMAQAPAAVKMAEGDTKPMLKQAMRGVLPDEILDRSKRGFGAPMGDWLKHGLKPMRDVLVCQRTVEQRGLLNWSEVSSLMDDHDANRGDHADLLMVLVNLELWHRVFVDGRCSADVAGELEDRLAAAAA